METKTNYNFENLYEIARENLTGLQRLALAVSGSPCSLALIKIAAEVLGKENVLVITADTGLLTDSEWLLIEKACETAEVTISVIPVDAAVFHEQNTYEHKRELFRELVHEAWMQGFETIADACTDDNRTQNGNTAQSDLGVISPFCTK